jgi:hypothetical protein
MGQVVTFPGVAESAVKLAAELTDEPKPLDVGELLPPDLLCQLFLRQAVELRSDGFTGDDIYHGLIGAMARLCHLPSDDAVQRQRRLLRNCGDLERAMGSPPD